MSQHLVARRRHPVQSLDAPVLALVVMGIAMVVLLVVTR